MQDGRAAVKSARPAVAVRSLWGDLGGLPPADRCRCHVTVAVRRLDAHQVVHEEVVTLPRPDPDRRLRRVDHEAIDARAQSFGARILGGGACDTAGVGNRANPDASKVERSTRTSDVPWLTCVLGRDDRIPVSIPRLVSVRCGAADA